MTLPPLRVEDNPPTSSHSRRPSSSWIRRLSFQPEKRSSFQRPNSPAFVEPATPVSPAFSRPSSQRRTPNKLVKRPKSQHSNGRPFSAHPVSSPLAPSTLRRPATSHQRSETIKHRPTYSLGFEPSLALGPLVEPASRNIPLENEPWHPYLAASADVSSPERLNRRFSTPTRPRDQAVRRILPQTENAPALLLATSITHKENPAKPAPDAPCSPAPVEFRDPFKVDDPSLQQSTLQPMETGVCQPPFEEAPESPAESTCPLDVREFRNGSFTGPKKRAVSTPLPALPNMEGAIWVSPRAPERRNITDPSIFRRPPNTSANGALPALFSSGIMGSQSKGFSSHGIEHNTGLGQHRHRESGQHASPDGSALPSACGSLRRRPKRHSIAASDPPSTVIGSDDTRVFTSGDEDETDFMSDTAFDSIRTHLTTDSSCFQPPRIESIFDKNIAPGVSDEAPAGASGTPSPCSHSLLKQPHELNVDRETLGVSSLTPVTQSHTDVHEGYSEVSFPSDLSDEDDVRSMVAPLPGDKTLRPSRDLASFGTLSLDDSRDHPDGQAFPIAQDIPPEDFSVRESIELDSNSLVEESHDATPKMNIFDWSEQSKTDREGSGPGERPRTVHGKHGPGMRGSRASGRKPPSALHYRSQSVPVAREPTTSNESRQASGKFGTWGLGSKGVSEDWDSDFDFDEKDKDECTMHDNLNPKKHVSRPSVVVPQAIMERQASLHGQFGQVQELTLLVEELKRLRHQASFLGIVRGSSNKLWKEAEGIVDLATLDDEDNNQSPPRSPSSLTFSFDESEGDSSQPNDSWNRVSGDSMRASISENSSTRPVKTPCPDQTVNPTKANSVLDMIYRQRSSQETSALNSHPSRSKKLPFDTQSLHDLVIRAGAVTRALKEVVRKAEGVTNGSEESTHPSHPAFSRIFEHPSHDDLSRFKTTCIS